MPSSHLILCRPLLLLPPIPPSIRVFSNESTLHMRWPKYWSFSFSISPSNEHPGLISFRMDWLDLLAVQAILKSFLQHHSSKASVLQHSAFFTIQLSHPYMTTGKTLTRQTFVGKVMSLLLNMLSRLVITFLPRSKCLVHFFNFTFYHLFPLECNLHEDKDFHSLLYPNTQIIIGIQQTSKMFVEWMDTFEDKSSSLQVSSLHSYLAMWYILGKVGFFL